MAFPLYTQFDSNDCGATCLRMIAKYYGISYNASTMRRKTETDTTGVSMLGLKKAADDIGLTSHTYKADWESLCSEIKLPCIIHWNGSHFVVAYKIKKETVYIADPCGSRFKYGKEDFLKHWLIGKDDENGIAMELFPTEKFYSCKGEKIKKFNYLKSLRLFKGGIFQFVIATLVGSLISLVFPFLTQATVDIGIHNRDLDIVILLVIAQLALAAGQLCNDMIRGLLMGHITSRINMVFVSDFINKLMRLPIAFFDAKKIGDIIQRIDDNSRIRDFLTNSLTGIAIAAITFITYTVIMAGYDYTILCVFFAGSLIYIGWVFLFLKKRKELDKRRFSEMSANQGNTIQLITGMQEIKLNNCEKEKLWEWEKIQTKLYKIGIKTITLEQIQSAGGTLINQIKNVLISFIAARLVIDGEISLGIMMAMQYITGQLNAPIGQFIGFVQSAQDANISMERLGEIYNREDEEPGNSAKKSDIPQLGTIEFRNVSFSYDKNDSPPILNNISFLLNAGKVNAIVGASGSGKSTILKLILGFYKPDEGDILLNGESLSAYSVSAWRNRCGVIMQDGYIFSDTISRNITLTDEEPYRIRLDYAADMANIREYVHSLPLGYKTVIGIDGKGLSMGQKQRILIARAIYKKPDYFFMDEATNSLDSANENAIMSNFEKFYKNRTVVVIAHRLSTVKNADNIIVLDKGRIAEQGRHENLLLKKGVYYNFIKNQL